MSPKSNHSSTLKVSPSSCASLLSSNSTVTASASSVSPNSTSPIVMAGAICRSLLLTVSLFASVLILSGMLICGGVVGVQGQQSGHLPLTSSGQQHHTQTQTQQQQQQKDTLDTSASTNSISSNGTNIPLAANTNNYAASVSLLTASAKPNQYHGYHSNSNKNTGEKLFASKSSVIPSFSFSNSMRQEKPAPSYYNIHSKHQTPISDAYYSPLYSPYMMPVGNYYTGSSSTVSSVASPSSPYMYSHYNTQTTPKQSSGSSASSLLSGSSPSATLASFKDKLMKSASSNRVNSTTPKTEAELNQEKMMKQLQMAMMYQQLLTMQQQYRSGMYGTGSAYSYPQYPTSMASLYYGQQAGLDSAGSNGGFGSAGMSAASSNSASTLASDSDSDSDQSTSSTTKSAMTDTSQIQQLAAILAYRQQLAQLYPSLYGGGGGGYGGGASSMYGGAGSSLYGGAGSSLYGGGGSLYGGSGLGGYGSGGYGGYGGGLSSLYSGAGGGYPGGAGFSSLYGSAMPIGGNSGMLSSLTGGLSSLTGSGSGALGVLSTLGMLFG